MPKKPARYRPSALLLEAASPGKAVALGHHAKAVRLTETTRIDGKLPALPEYLRDFAFRYALENRAQVDWAKAFHVSPATIAQWIRRPDVLKYVITLRYERRLRHLEMSEQAETKALRKLNEILDQKVVPGNMSTLLTAIFKTLQLTREGSVAPDGGDTNLNVTLNQFADNRQIHVSEEALEERLQELEAVERVLAKPRSPRVADPVPIESLPSDATRQEEP